MWRINLSAIILCISLDYAHQYKISDVKTSKSATLDDKHFDVIVLSQLWPVTACKFMKYVLYPGDGCIFPKQKNQWTIHGIWPRDIGGKYLQFCNKSWAFDRKQISSIEDDLKQAQFQVYEEVKPHTFWSWEWRRHGTCAAAFEPFNLLNARA